MRRGIRSWVRLAAATALMSTVAAPPLCAQGEAVIRGTVSAAVDGSPLPGASVALRPDRGEALSTTSGADGAFAFPLVTPGAYRLVVSIDGFVSRTIGLTVEPREIRTLSLGLELQRVEATVEVSGAIASLGDTHSPSSTVLAADRFDRLPASQHQMLPDAIVAAAPGMIRGHDDFVHVRGQEVALNPIINGVSFWENPHALFSAGVSPTMIEAVNVMTGGFPAEYGNRFGGVLDVVTKSGLRMRDDGSLVVAGGEAGRRSLVGEFGGHRGRYGYYAFGSFTASDRVLSPPDPRAVHDNGHSLHGFFQGDANLGRAGSLRLVIMGDGADFEIPQHPRDLELRPLARADQRARQQSAILGWTRAGSHTLASASGYQRWSRTRLSPAAGPLTAAAALDRRLVTIGGKVDVTRFSGRHAVKMGVDAVHLRPAESLFYDYAGFRELTHRLGLPHLHVTGGPIAFDDAAAGGQISAYVQDTVALGRVSLNAGVRLDRYDLVVTATHASPRVNVAVDAGGGAIVHASYNRFFVPPPIEGVGSNAAGLTSRIGEIGVALPALEPSIEDQLELGASGAVGPLRVGLTAYYRATDNPVHTTVWPDSRIYSYASFDRERAYGLEARAELPALTRLGLGGYLNYALGRVTFYNPVTGGFFTDPGHLAGTDGFRAPMDQTHTLTAGATYRHARSGLWAGLMLEYGSGTPMGHGGADHDHGDAGVDHEDGPIAQGPSRVPDHFTASFSSGVDLLRDGRGRGRVSLQLDVENVTNDIYLIAQEGEFSPAQYSIPRLVSLTLKYRF